MDPVSNPDDIGDILDHAVHLLDKWDDEKDVSDLEQAIQHFQRVVDGTATVTSPATTSDRYRLHGLVGLGSAYREKSAMITSIQDIEKSIEYLCDAVKLSPSDDVGLCDRLNQLGFAYWDKYDATKNGDDLQRCIQVADECVALDTKLGTNISLNGITSSQWGDFPAWLGEKFQSVYLHSGSLSHLETALQLFKQALGLAAGDNSRRGSIIASMGRVFGDKHQATGAMGDLAECISCYRDAYDLLPQDHEARVELLRCLAIAYRDRYLKQGSLDDIQLSVSFGTDSLKLMRLNDPDRPAFLCSLGASYWDMFEQTLDPMHQIRSHELREEGSGLMSDQVSGQRGTVLANLANAHHNRYRRTDNKKDLDQAICHMEEAMQHIPEVHQDYGHRFFSLGIMYRSQYKEQPEPSDVAILQRAIELQKTALKKLPEESTLRASWLFEFGSTFLELYYTLDDESDWETAVQIYANALGHVSSGALYRLLAGQELLQLYSAEGRWPEAYEAALKTLSLIPLLTSPSLDKSDQLRLMSYATGLGSNAAALALTCGKPADLAIQHLEIGHGAILERMNQVRVSEGDLENSHPKLAEKSKLLSDLRAQIERPAAAVLGPHQENGRYEAGQKLEALLAEIQPVLEIKSTLSKHELMAAADRGPIVVINTSPNRCDALIIKTSGICVVKLPNVNLEFIQDYSSKGNPDDSSSGGILEILWRDVAKPILDELGFTETPSDGCWPHVWWIPTGVLTNFPIHAFGYHSPTSSDAVIDRVISSYSTSVKALLYGRSRQQYSRQSQDAEEVVLVAMETTQGQSNLHFAGQEVAQLEGLCHSLNLKTSKPEPVQQDVLKALNHCKIFHFAGHGVSDHEDPLKSSLLLRDWQTNALTVECLWRSNLYSQGPLLAYLSACSTSKIGHAEFVDEGLHLISACQLAGFRNVIGTLWEVDDQICVGIALETYKWIGSHGFNDDSISEGLHHAIRSARGQWIQSNVSRKASTELRKESVTGRSIIEGKIESSDSTRDDRDASIVDDKENDPLHWVPYVHFGL